MHWSGILNALAFQSFAWLGCVPNHFIVMGVFVNPVDNFFEQIFNVLGNLSLNLS